MPQHRKQVTYSQRPNHAARSAHARGERQFRTYDTSYIRPKKSKAPAIVAAVLAVLVVGGLAWGALTLFNSCSAQSVELLAEGQEATITVAEGAGAKVVGEQLAEARLVSNAGDFTKRVNEMGVDSQLKPGTYTFAGGMPLDAIINQLTAGPVANALTIPEGSTLEAVAQSVATFTENRITADAFTAAASDASAYAADYDFLADAGTNSLEGFLFPKTYEIGDDATAESVVRMMLDQFKTETSGLDWSYPQSQGLTIYDAVKLASIVERESSGDEQIRAQVEESTSDYDREKLQERLAKLVGGVAVVHVGAATEVEMKEKKDRVEDALNATRAAVEEGIVPGGGTALIRVSKVLDSIKPADDDELAGVNIIRNAIEAPLRQIAHNAGFEGSIVVEKVRQGKDGFGFNAATGEYEDLIKAGVIDPKKVARIALQNAASVASLLLTTECAIAEKPEPKKDMPAMPDMGGMGGMGGMY